MAAIIKIKTGQWAFKTNIEYRAQDVKHKKKTYTHTKNVRNTNNNNKLDNNNNKNKNPVREIYSDYYRYFSHIKLKDISIPVIEKSNKNKSQKDRRLDDLSALEVNLSIVQ